MFFGRAYEKFFWLKLKLSVCYLGVFLVLQGHIGFFSRLWLRDTGLNLRKTVNWPIKTHLDVCFLDTILSSTLTLKKHLNKRNRSVTIIENNVFFRRIRLKVMKIDKIFKASKTAWLSIYASKKSRKCSLRPPEDDSWKLGTSLLCERNRWVFFDVSFLKQFTKVTKDQFCSKKLVFRLSANKKHIDRQPGTFNCDRIKQ